MNPFGDIYKGKKVLVTGHTGFKGSWLSLWLINMGARVIGYSSYIPSKPSNFEVCNLEKHLENFEGDVRDFDKLNGLISNTKPDIVFHLAAQPIVRKSYDDPKSTFDTNIGGTVNVLESIRKNDFIKAAVIITSDKCYKNFEWIWGYREIDALGGDDPYSASKGCAELIFRSYTKSFFNLKDKPGICSVRAGNVIGGGDWADARIVPDCVRAWAEDSEVIIRSPQATRPWQHVLEPLSGYLWVGANLYNSDNIKGESFNFGPDSKVNQSVEELIVKFNQYWKDLKWKTGKSNNSKKESNLLKLSCDKSLNVLNWHAALTFEETVRYTAEWYKSYYKEHKDMYKCSIDQINDYIKISYAQNLSWAKGELL